MKNKKALEMMKQAMMMLEQENYPASEESEDAAEYVQQAQNMAGPAVNAANLSDDAENKDQGGYKSNMVADGMGQSEEEKRALRRKAVVATFSKGK